MTADDRGERLRAWDAFRTVARGGVGGLVGTVAGLILVVLLLTTVVVGIPIAVWLVFRASFVGQAFALEGLTGPQALRRSFGLVRGRWWRRACSHP